MVSIVIDLGSEYLVVTSTSLVVTSALLVVTRSERRNNKLIASCS